LAEGENKTEKWESEFRVHLPLPEPILDSLARAPKWIHAGCVDWSSGRRWVSERVGPLASEIDEGFEVARSGRRADLLVPKGACRQKLVPEITTNLNFT